MTEDDLHPWVILQYSNQKTQRLFWNRGKNVYDGREQAINKIIVTLIASHKVLVNPLVLLINRAVVRLMMAIMGGPFYSG